MMSSQAGSPSPETPLPETLRLRSRGVVTLPKKLRDKYDLGEGEALRLVDLGGVFAITPMRPMVPELAREIERMREEAGLSTEELLESLRAERRRSYRERYADPVARLAEEALEIYAGEAGRWRWRLLRPGGPTTGGPTTGSPAGDVLAESPESYADQARAEEALRAFKKHAEDARMETSRVAETSQDATSRDAPNAFTWRLRTSGGDVLAVGGARQVPYLSEEDARRAALSTQRVATALARGSGSEHE